MMAGRRARALRAALWVIAAAAGLAAVRPWTVRPLHLDKPAVFDASTYAQSAWSRVVSDATQQATDVTTTVDGPAKAQFVKGAGVVTVVDRASRVGLLRVRVAGLAIPVAIQVGPVIRGTALRDASAFIQFSDFTNQSDYAAAANALNDYALRHVIASLSLETMQGRMVAFTGAVGRSAVRVDGALEVVPLRIEVVEAAAK